MEQKQDPFNLLEDDNLIGDRFSRLDCTTKENVMEGADRLNELKDEMIVNNIMSRLDCTTQELIGTTATISKRWRNLWTQLPHLIFSHDKDSTFVVTDNFDLSYSSFIDNTLNQCPTDLNLKKYKLNFIYDSYFNPEFEARANRWIRYAINRNVEEVDLSFREADARQRFTFEDEIFFNTSCITRMTLALCRFKPPNGVIRWERLECLCLSDATLDEDMIDKILSRSPCLESLELMNCYGYRRIDVNSKSIKKLVFSEYYCYDESLEEDYIYGIKINAPYISSLIIKGELVLQELVLLNVSSLIKAELDYSIDCFKFVGWWKSEVSHEEIFRGLLESLDHVKDVTLNDNCWELYSSLKASGYTSNGCSLRLMS